MRKRLSKTLRRKSYEFNELENLYKQARAEAKSQIILGGLKLKFLGWLETSGPGNTHFKWETEQHSREHWESYSWQKAVEKFIDYLRDEDFWVDIVASENNFCVNVGLWDKNRPVMVGERSSRDVVKEIMEDQKSMPYEAREDLDSLFRSLVSLHDKDNCWDHPGYKLFREKALQAYKSSGDALKAKKALLADAGLMDEILKERGGEQ